MSDKQGQVPEEPTPSKSQEDASSSKTENKDVQEGVTETHSGGHYLVAKIKKIYVRVADPYNADGSKKEYPKKYPASP